jgi:transposase
MLLFYGIHLSEEQVKSHWSRRFLEWIEGLRMERSSGDLALQVHLAELRHLRQILVILNRGIRELSQTEEYREWVRLLKTIPGISTLTAMILLTELIDLCQRFSSLDQLSSFVGLIPDTKSSGETEHTGEITRRRHGQLRALLIEAAWVGGAEGSGAAAGF